MVLKDIYRPGSITCECLEQESSECVERTSCSTAHLSLYEPVSLAFSSRRRPNKSLGLGTSCAPGEVCRRSLPLGCRITGVVQTKPSGHVGETSGRDLAQRMPAYTLLMSSLLRGKKEKLVRSSSAVRGKLGARMFRCGFPSLPE